MNDKQRLIEHLLIMALCSSAPMKPGEVIKRLPEEKKKLLKELTSKDFKHWVRK